MRLRRSVEEKPIGTIVHDVPHVIDAIDTFHIFQKYYRERRLFGCASGESEQFQDSQVLLCVWVPAVQDLLIELELTLKPQ